MGILSAKAQRLGQPISSYKRIAHTDQRLYMKVSGNLAIGYIKVGPKKLFISTRQSMVEITPLCVLDFYVHESVQRQGAGQILFQYMLENEGKSAHQLGYDRPSPKFIKFLSTRYSLTEYMPQNNNFVVFNKYFTGDGGKIPGDDSKPSTASSMASRGSAAGTVSRPDASSAGLSTSRAPWAQDARNETPNRRERGHEAKGAIGSVAACLGLTSTSQATYRNPHQGQLQGAPSHMADQGQNCTRQAYNPRLCAGRPF